MPNDLMGEQNPFLARDHPHQVLLDILGIVILRELQPARNAMNVRVHDQTLRLAEPCSENYIRGLAGHSWESEQVTHVIGNSATEIIDDLARRPNHRLRFVPKEAGRANVWLKLLRFQLRE